MSEKETLINKLERGRADFAYKCVNEALERFKGDSKKQKEYRSHTRKIPQMILSNGLGQTLAFILSKKSNGNAYDLLYQQITDYLKSDSTSRIKMEGGKDLTEWVISLSSAEYRYVTQEILTFFNWLKRFAEGMIEGE